MKFSEDTIFVDEVVTNETTNGEAIDISHIYGYSVYASWSGSTISGSIKLQASLDNASWIDITSSSQTINSADSYLWNVTDAFYKYFRVVATSDDANAITVNAQFYAKGV